MLVSIFDGFIKKDIFNGLVLVGKKNKISNE